MWWSDTEWTSLASPESCGLCADAHLDENDHSLLIASTSTSHIRLARNQAHPGYCLVILRNHVTDLADLAPRDLAAFWTDVQRAGRAVAEVYAPRKIDLLVMGHRAPQLHCHVFPQHETDDPLRNVDISDGPALLTTSAARAVARSLAEAWASLDTSGKP